MIKFFNNLLNKINKKEKIMKGKKVKLVASISNKSNNAHIGNGKVYTVSVLNDCNIPVNGGSFTVTVGDKLPITLSASGGQACESFRKTSLARHA